MQVNQCQRLPRFCDCRNCRPMELPTRAKQLIEAIEAEEEERLEALEEIKLANEKLSEVQDYLRQLKSGNSLDSLSSDIVDDNPDISEAELDAIMEEVKRQIFG